LYFNVEWKACKPENSPIEDRGPEEPPKLLSIGGYPSPFGWRSSLGELDSRKAPYGGLSDQLHLQYVSKPLDIWETTD